MQVIASFKQKFRGFYTEKEILGSVKVFLPTVFVKHFIILLSLNLNPLWLMTVDQNIGIAEAYLRKSLSFSNARRRVRLFSLFTMQK